MHVGLEALEQPRHGRVREDDDVVDAAERGDELGAVRRRAAPAGPALQRRHRLVVVDRDDQAVGLGRRALQVADVADVQQVEAAVGEGDGAPGCAVRADTRLELALGQHLRLDRG